MLVDGTRSEFELWSPIMRQATAVAPQDDGIQDAVTAAHDSLRRGLLATAVRLGELDALRAGVTVDEAADVLWYFLGNASYFTLTDDCRWPLDRAADWLHQALKAALLGT